MGAEMTKFPGKVTIYSKSEFGFGYRKAEAREASWSIGPYAQYASALKITFKRARERVARGFHDAMGRSYGGMGTIVLEGWGHPDPESMWKTVSEDEKTVTQESKHTAFSGEWDKSFGEMMDAYIEKPGVKVLLDVRGQCSHDKI